jgi:hypothetical protein
MNVVCCTNELFKEHTDITSQLAKYSKTRLIGAFLMGDRFLRNERILRKICEAAMKRHKGQYKEKKSSLAKFPVDLEPEFDEIFSKWRQIGKFSGFFNTLVEFVSADQYPRLSELVPALFVLVLQLLYVQQRREEFKIDDQIFSFIGSLKTKIQEELKMLIENPVVCAALVTNPKYRDFDPSYMDETTPEAKLLKEQYAYLNVIHGNKIRRRAAECYYSLFPTLAEEMKNDKKLTMLKDADRMDEMYAATKFGKELNSYCELEFDSLEDSKTTTGKVSYTETDVPSWLFRMSTFQRVKQLGLATQMVPISQISCERLWKMLDGVITKKRASIGVERAVNTVFLGETWKLAKRIPEFEEILPPQFK